MNPGLCGRCLHARKITNRAGSVFWLCEAYKTFPQMVKYPPIPVVSCPVFEYMEPRLDKENDGEEDLER